MDHVRHKLLLVINEVNKYAGLLSIGDIQRAIIRNVNLSDPVSSIMRNDYIVAKPEDSIEEIKKMMLGIRSEFMPVVNHDNILVKVYFWEDLFGSFKIEPSSRFSLPVVIMAGGEGIRLRPLTYVLPKPLIPIGEKTMLEEIFQRFSFFGCNDFYISVNYKADLINYYIKDRNLSYNVTCFKETTPLGTAGSLSLLRNKIDKTFFVTNCDILIEQDYSEILDYHRQNKNEITIVSALRHFPLAYGAIIAGENGELESLTEKPELTFRINSGMYIMEPALIDEIPDNVKMDITDLIKSLSGQKRKVGVFPVTQNSWIDIGNWEDYLALIRKHE